MPIIEGGTNTTSFTTTDGVIYYDGTKLTTTNVGVAGQVLLSQGGAGNPPIFQSIPSGGKAIFNSTTQLNETPQYSCLTSTNNYVGTTATNTPSVMAFSGTFSLLNCYMPTNTSVTDTIVTLFVNGSATALTVTIPAASTTLVIDSTHSVSVNAGDLVGFQVTSTVQPSRLRVYISMAFA